MARQPPLPISAPPSVFSAREGLRKERRAVAFCCLALDQAPCAARIAGRGIQAAEGRLAYGGKPPISKRIRDETINAIIGGWTGRLRGQALFTPRTAPTCFGKDAAVRPPKGGQEAILPPTPHGVGGSVLPLASQGAGGSDLAARPPRGEWEKLRRSLLKGGSGCSRAVCPSRGGRETAPFLTQKRAEAVVLSTPLKGRRGVCSVCFSFPGKDNVFKRIGYIIYSMTFGFSGLGNLF